MLAGPGPSYCCLLVPRDCFRKIGPLDEATKSLTDWDTCISLARDFGFVTLDEPCTIVHQDGLDRMLRNKHDMASGYLHIVEKYRDDILRLIGKRGLAWHFRKLRSSSMLQANSPL